jgi:peptidoglycan-N-acetylmuramic acid deacetylase
MSKRRQRQKRIRQMKILTAAAAVLLVVVAAIVLVAGSLSKNQSSNSGTSNQGNLVSTAAETTEAETSEAETKETETEEETTAAATTEEETAAQNEPAATVSLEEGQELVYATVRVNIRSIPDTTGDILGKLDAGESIVRTADENGWSTVDYNGVTAYISSEYLSTTEPQTQAAASGSNASKWPTLEDGSWDLSAIPNDESSIVSGQSIIGFGYSEQNRDPVTNIPTDWQYYENNWGMFNVDWIQDTSSNVIYLTMDEGYPNTNTITILETLREKNVKVVFFITKYFFDGCQDLIQEMLDDGHIVGNHSCTHPSMPTLGIEGETEEIMTLHNLMLDTFGYEMKLFRFPQGNYTSQSLALVDNLGYKSVFWSYAYLDYDMSAQADPAVALQDALDHLHPGAIYLLHADSDTNMTILGDFIDGARARGFEFGTYPLEAN